VHLIGIVQIIIQVYFAVHAARTGRYWWIFIILFFPIIGSLIYFFVEYLPELQIAAKLKNPRNVNPAKQIKQLQQELEITDSIKNRMDLAEAYFHAGEYQASIDLLEKSLVGVNAKDPHILEGLCFSCFHNRNFEKTKKYLSELEEATDGKLANNLRLMRARTHEALGKEEAALKEYQSIINICTGEEARCRYALLLKKLGQRERARELFEEIIKNAKLYPRQYSKFQSEWVNIAKEQIK